MNFKKYFLTVVMLLILSLFTFQSMFSQEATKKANLLDSTFSKYLNLNKEQISKVVPFIDSIKTIQKAQKARMEKFRAMRESGERPDMDEMMKMRSQRDKEVTDIKNFIEQIKKSLTPEQLDNFKNVELPNLEMRRGGGRPNN